MTEEVTPTRDPLSHPFFVVGVANRYAPTLEPLECTVGDFLQAIVHEVGEKDGLAFIPARFLTYDGGRLQELVNGLTALVLDFDHPSGNGVDQILDGIHNFGVAYSTFTHAPDSPRFRVVFPFRREVTSEEFRRIWTWAHQRYGAAMDATCNDLARLYYLPRVPSKEALNHAWVRRLDGPILDPDEILAMAPPVSAPEATRPERTAPIDVALSVGVELLGLARSKDKVQCPNHADPEKHANGDADPSAHDYGDHLYCFVCQQRFDVYDLIMRARQCTYAEAQAAVRDLANESIRRSLPHFPLEALPTGLRIMAEEISDSVQIDVSVPAMALLGVVAGVGAGRFHVRVGTTHDEPIALWIAIALPSGERKSAVLRRVLKPVRDWEKDQLATYAVTFKVAEERIRLHADVLKGLRSRAAKEKELTKRRELEKQVEELAARTPELPPTPELVCSDITPEAMGQRLADQNGVALLASDEGGGPLGNLNGRYSDRANPDVFLQAHSGEPIKIHRIGRPPNVIQRPALGMVLMMQPHLLGLLRDDPMMRRVGVVARFLFCVPPSRVGFRLYANREIDPDVDRLYQRTVKQLLRHQAHREPSVAPKELRIEGDALSAWKKFHDGVEVDMRPGGRLCTLADWGSKLPGAVARIAGALHLFENFELDPADAPIRVETVENAARIGEFLIHHALGAFDLASKAGADETMTAILAWAARRDDTCFSQRDFLQDHRKVNPTAFRTAADALVESGRLRSVAPEAGKPGRPPGPRWELLAAPEHPITPDAQHHEPFVAPSIFAPDLAAESVQGRREAAASRQAWRDEQRANATA